MYAVVFKVDSSISNLSPSKLYASVTYKPRESFTIPCSFRCAILHVKMCLNDSPGPNGL